MSIDVRAETTCNLGPLISASISDSYVQGAGLVKTTGSCVIAALIKPAPGSKVVFQYTKGGTTRVIPRSLRVLSSFADPFRDTTSVELGCILTYMDGASEPIDWAAFDDPENQDLTQQDQEIIVVPIHAESVANKCLQAIGLPSTTLGLTNKFSIASFDFSSGYVSILNDLLISESLCGYVDEGENFRVFSLEPPLGGGRLITEGEIIDVSSIGSGELPSDLVVVNYSTLKLKEPDPTEQAYVKNWEYDEEYGLPTEIIMQGNYFSSGDEWTNVFNFTPKTSTVSVYDTWDRLVRRSTLTTSILADVNPEYTKTWISKTGYGPLGLQKIYKISRTITRYKKPAPVLPPNESFYRKPELEEGYDEVLDETSITYEPDVTKLGSVAGNYYDAAADRLISLSFNITGAPLSPSYENPDIFITSDASISQRTTTKTVTYSRNVSIAGLQGKQLIGNIPVTKTITKQEKIYAQTSRGQQYVASKTEEGKMIDEIAGYAGRLVDAGVELKIVSGREAVVEMRPTTAESNIASLADGGNPNNGYTTESSNEIEVISGNKFALRRTELSMPYAPDDVFEKIGSGQNVSYKVIPSDAPQKAAKYGRIQNRLLFGVRNGVGIQTEPELLSNRPYSPFYLKMGNTIGSYAMNGTTWTIDSSGIIASTDGIFLGVASKA